MDSGSGKNQDVTEAKEPVDSQRPREESNAAASSSSAASSSATESPPLAPESEIIEVEAHGPQEAGGQDTSAATATGAAAEQKGEDTMSIFWKAWAPPPGGKRPVPACPPSVSRARGPSSARGKGKEALESIVEDPVDLEDVFSKLMLDAKKRRSEKTDQEAEEGTPRQQDEQENSPPFWPKKGKKSLRRKILDRIGISNQKYTTLPHVSYQKNHITEIITHYDLLEMVAGRGVLFHTHALNLRRTYSEFRPVHGDGECFYRSFIFSYLEQVLDRQDKNEEHRVLAAVKGVARQHARLGWFSEFSRSHKAFKKLIKKVMRWKRHRGWKHVPTVKSYRIEKLLEFFNNYKRTDDIFTFLRLVAAIWICSHSEEFVPLIPELNEGHTLTEWCFQEVVQRRVFTDHIQITALVRALRVPLRVEYLFQEAGQDLYTGQVSQDDMRQVPPDHEVPRVTVLYTQEHYDIIYPYHPDGSETSDKSSDQRSDKTESLPAKSSSQYQTGSCSGTTSSQQIDRVEDSTSTGEKSDKHTAEGGS